MANTVKTKLVMDGEREYKQSLTAINKEFAMLRSEMSLVKAKFSDQANSLEALKSKQKVYIQQIELQNKKVAETKKAMANAIDNQKDYARKLEESRKKLSSAEAEMDRFRKTTKKTDDEIKEQEKTVEKLRKELQVSENEYQKSGNTVTDWRTKLNKAEAELTKLNKEVTINERYMHEAKESTDKCASSIDNYGKKVKFAADVDMSKMLHANVWANAISQGAMLATRSLGKLVDAAKEGVELASDLAESQNVVDVTFQNNAKTIDEWSTGLASSFGVSTLNAKKYVGTMGAMLASMQMSDDAVLSMSTSLVELAADFASFYNLPLEEAFTKIRSGISGETEPLKQLGINLSVANLEAYALSKGIETSYKKMTEAEKVTLRYNYLMKVGANAIGDFARTSDSFANQQKILTLEFENMKTEFGEGLVPELTKGIDVITDKIGDMNIDLEETGKNIGGFLVTGFSWIIENAEYITAGIAGMTAAIITYRAAVSLATTVQMAFNVAASITNPIALATTVIVGGAAAIGGYSIATKTLGTDMETMADKVNKSTASLQESINAAKTSIAELETQKKYVTNLKNELIMLNQKESLNAVEKKRLLDATNQLNHVLPNLNLTIDEQTGHLEGNTDAIKQNIEQQYALVAAQAIQEQMTDVMKEKAVAEYECEMAEIRLAEIEERLTNITGERAVATENYNELLSRGLDTTLSYQDTIGDLYNEERALKEEQEALNPSIAAYEETIESLNPSIDNMTTYLEEQYGVMTEDTKATLDAAGANGELAASTDVVSSAATEAAAAIEEAYQKMYTSISDAVASSMGAFEKFDAGTKVSADEISTNIQSQIDGISQWGDNLESLASRTDVAVNQGVLQYLADMGPQGAAYAASFAEMTTEELQKANDQMVEYMTLPDEVATQVMESYEKCGEDAAKGYMDGMVFNQEEAITRQREMTEELQKVVKDVDDSHSPSKAYEKMGKDKMDGLKGGIKNNEVLVTNQMTTSAKAVVESAKKVITKTEFEKIGKRITDGMAAGIKSGKNDVVNAIKDVCEAAVAKANSTLEINSPSKRFEKVGSGSMEGYIDGWKSKVGEMISVINDTMNTAASVKPVQYGIAGDAGSLTGTDETMPAGAIIYQTIHIHSQTDSIVDTAKKFKESQKEAALEW